MPPHEIELLKDLKYVGRLAGVAPVYIGIFEKGPAIIMAKPYTSPLLSLVEFLWNFVASVSGKRSYVGVYPVKITGRNPHYEPGVGDEDNDK